MNTEPLTQELLLRAIKTKGFKYMIDSDDDILIRFNGESSFGDTDIYFGLRGGKKDVLKGFTHFKNRISRQKLPEMVFLCNQFHMKYSFPCMFVHIPEGSESQPMLMSQFWIDLEKGTDIDAIQNFIASYVGGIASFEKWATEKGASPT